MHQFWRHNIRLNISFIALMLGMSSIVVHSAPASASQSTIPQVPDQLKVPDGQNLILKTSAKGVQIYSCQAKKDNPDQFEWSLKAPNAKLFDEQGQFLGLHYAGPTWQAKDSSKVMGTVETRADAPRKNAIPWLLLKGNQQEGSGVFSQVSWIQRLNTVGGKPRTETCDRSLENRELLVRYSADYYFYGASTAKED